MRVASLSDVFSNKAPRYLIELAGKIKTIKKKPVILKPRFSLYQTELQNLFNIDMYNRVRTVILRSNFKIPRKLKKKYKNGQINSLEYRKIIEKFVNFSKTEDYKP